MEVQITTNKNLINIHNLSNNGSDLDWSLPLNGNSSSLVNKWSEEETENWNRNRTAHKCSKKHYIKQINWTNQTTMCIIDYLSSNLFKYQLIMFQYHRHTQLTVTPQGLMYTEDKIIDCSSNSSELHILSNPYPDY